MWDRMDEGQQYNPVIWTFCLSCLQKNITDLIKQNGMDNHVYYRL